MSPVEFKKRLCNPVEFKGQGPPCRMSNLRNGRVALSILGVKGHMDTLAWRQPGAPWTKRTNGSYNCQRTITIMSWNGWKKKKNGRKHIEVHTVTHWLSPVVDITFLWNEAVVFFCGDVTFPIIFGIIKSITDLEWIWIFPTFVYTLRFILIWSIHKNWFCWSLAQTNFWEGVSAAN